MPAQPRNWVIYVLADPKTPDDVRYVGVTHEGARTRLRRHVSWARKTKRTSHLANWLRKLLADAVCPVISVIDRGTGESWGLVESWWIQWHRERGFRLTNATDGGEGAVGHKVSEEARAKMRAARLGKAVSPEAREQMRLGQLGKKASPATKAKRSAALKKKLSAMRANPEVWAKRSEALKKGWATRIERMRDVATRLDSEILSILTDSVDLLSLSGIAGQVALRRGYQAKYQIPPIRDALRRLAVRKLVMQAPGKKKGKSFSGWRAVSVGNVEVLP